MGTDFRQGIENRNNNRRDGEGGPFLGLSLDIKARRVEMTNRDWC